jgi:hypothetical protein
MRLLGRLALLSITPVACSPCSDVQQYAPGTTFEVTVPQAYSGCHVTFDAGATYPLVAGALDADVSQDGAEAAACKANRVDAPPGFTTSEYAFTECGVEGSPLGMECEATVPACTSPFDIRLEYKRLPRSRGEQVDSILWISYGAVDTVCPTAGCLAQIPVSISW